MIKFGPQPDPSPPPLLVAPPAYPGFTAANRIHLTVLPPIPVLLNPIPFRDNDVRDKNHDWTQREQTQLMTEGSEISHKELRYCTRMQEANE